MEINKNKKEQLETGETTETNGDTQLERAVETVGDRRRLRGLDRLRRPMDNVIEQWETVED